MATIAAPSFSHKETPYDPAHPTKPAARPARRAAADWTDRETGLMAAAVVGALALVFVLIIAGVLLYATTWGYAVTLG